MDSGSYTITGYKPVKPGRTCGTYLRTPDIMSRIPVAVTIAG